MDPANDAPLFHVGWEQDKLFRMSPDVVTSLLREQVPVLDFVDWRVTSIEFGQASSTMPLNPQSTNQHFTHQAAMFVLSADYTGGTALASLLGGWPVVGVHPVTSPESVSLWLLKTELKYLRPSVGDLTVTAVIDADKRRRVQQRFLAGKPVIETITMEFRNGETVVAEASATYFARQSTALRAEGLDAERVNSLYELKLTSSAELIAGVRARETGGLFEDPYARAMAGQHGVALATRFCQRSPQLGGMVAARTRHLDTVVENFVEAGGRHIVNVGVGWDMRAFRLPLPEGTTFYELDFPTTLRERRQRLDEQGVANPPGVERIETPIDVRTMPLAKTLEGIVPSDKPLLVIWEGMNMYFQEDEVRDILAGIRPLLAHPESLLWLDLVERDAIVNADQQPPSVREFMRGMQILGEPFTFGTDHPQRFLLDNGLSWLESVSSEAYFQDAGDPVYSIYRFCVAASAPLHHRDVPQTFRPTRVDGPARNPAPHVGFEGARNGAKNGFTAIDSALAGQS
ncbi:SAM-dependent methyltransferase [Pirellulimonas nuda]|nr:SAM-dependent methyltransferase [Pirellulimonas nuda]